MFPDPFHDKFNQVRERVTRAHNVCSSRSKFPFQSQKYVFYLVCSLGMDPPMQCSKIGFEPALNLASVSQGFWKRGMDCYQTTKEQFSKRSTFPRKPKWWAVILVPPEMKNAVQLLFNSPKIRICSLYTKRRFSGEL